MMVDVETEAPLSNMAQTSVTSVQFAEAARRLGETARQLGYVSPALRSPPRVAGSRRTIQRRKDGSATVAIALRGRAHGAVLADVIDGIVAANSVMGPDAEALRDALWEGATPLLAAAPNAAPNTHQPLSDQRAA